MPFTAKGIPGGAVTNAHIWNRTLYYTERRVRMAIVIFQYYRFCKILLESTCDSYRAWEALRDAIAKKCVHGMNVKSLLATAFANPFVVFILLRPRRQADAIVLQCNRYRTQKYRLRGGMGGTMGDVSCERAEARKQEVALLALS